MNEQQQRYYDQIKAIVEMKGGTMISTNYTRMIDKMVFRCQDGHFWDTEARSILKGMWCRYCHGNTREQGEERFRQRVKEKGGLILGAYTGNHGYVMVQCAEGHQWEILPYNLCAGKWCPTCAYRNHKGGSTRFLKTLEERKGTLLDRYINSRTRVRVQCDKGHIWSPRPYYIVTGNWCPLCTGSNGETYIALYLTEKGIAYETQKTIDGLPRKRFDFLINYNGQKWAIEYDGEQHFKFTKYYHGNQEYFKYRQAVDRVKTIHPLNNGYRMIRIDYSQLLNIPQQLDKAFASNDILYVSTPSKYDGWLLGAQVPAHEFALVSQGVKKPEDDEFEEPEDPVEQIITGLSLVIIR